MKEHTKENIALASISGVVTAFATYYVTRFLRGLGSEQLLMKQLAAGGLSESFARRLIDEQMREDVILSISAGLASGIGAFVILQSTKAVRKMV